MAGERASPRRPGDWAAMEGGWETLKTGQQELPTRKSKRNVALKMCLK